MKTFLSRRSLASGRRSGTHGAWKRTGKFFLILFLSRKRMVTALLTLLTLCTLTACAAPEPSAPPPDPPAAETEPPAPPPPPPPEPTEEELAAERVETLLSSMTLEEKAGQVFFVRCPASGAAEDTASWHLGGYLLFSRDFQDESGGWLTEAAFTEKIRACQDAAAIPLLIGVDEEGGSVVRASRNPNLFPEGKFRSPQRLLKNQSDGDIFAEDAWEKSAGLLRLGINVNLAPVCDVSMDPGSFIYDRTLGLDAEATADYVKSVVSAMSGSGIGSVLKHFPGYGDNDDTHTGSALDQRPLETFLTEDLLPFRAGAAAGGGLTAVLVSHNVVACMDEGLPASLSPAVHELLRRELDFDGVVMTDDLDMKAISTGEGSPAVMALAAGNDLLITARYREEIPAVIAAVEDGTLSEDMLDTACRRVLTWKQALGLIP